MVVDVAEVRLGRAVERLDDLVAARGDGLGVAGDLVEQAARARGGVVDLVDVGAELAAARGHAALGGARADPVAGAAGVDEQLLDLGGRGRLEGRHRGGADQDAVERHGREAVARRTSAPVRYSAARSGVPMPPPTQTTTLARVRSSA